MTLREAAEQALEALEDPWSAGPNGVANAITALRAALAEPDGWRQCAVGQKTTQYCGLLEDAVEAAKDEAYSRGIDAGWALAQQSKAVQERNSGYTEEYAANVAAYARREEREACARVCELLRPSKREYDHRFYDACTASAAVIRTRGMSDS